MNWLVLLYNTLVVVVALDAMASLLASAYMFRLRQRFGMYLAMMFAGVAAEACVMAFTMGQLPASQRAGAAVIAARILSRFAKTATMTALALYLLGYLNGDRAKPPTS